MATTWHCLVRPRQRFRFLCTRMGRVAENGSTASTRPHSATQSTRASLTAKDGGRQQESNLPGSAWRPLLGLKPSRTAGCVCLPRTVPAAVGPQNVTVADASGVADAIKEFQDLYRPFAAEPDCIAIAGGIHRSVLLAQAARDGGKLRDAARSIEE